MAITGFKKKNVGLTDVSEDNPLPVSMGQLVIKESFDEGDLSTGSYTATATYSGTVIGFGINNNSATNALTFTIGTVAIAVPATKQFYGVFTKPSPNAIAVTGTSVDFDAFIEG